MKVLIIIDSLGSGGAERSTEVLCDYLFLKDVKFEIICLDHKKVGVQERMERKGYLIRFLKNANFIKQVKEIAGIINTGQYDLVHSILFRSNLRTRFAKLFTSFVHLESLVNTTYSKERFADNKVNQFALRFYKILDSRSALRGVDHFHSITNTVKEHYIQEVGLLPNNITVISRGRKPFLDSYQEKQIDNKKIHFINIGRHEFQKGQIYLLKGAKLLKDKGYNFNLSIYGRDGTVTPEMKEYILKNKMENFVFLAGYKNNIPDLLLKADVFVFPSLYEGLGGAMIEAQAAGLPVACNNIPVFREVVIENENAKFFESHDPISIAKALEFFIENPEERIAYGKKSLQNFHNKFLEEENNEKLLTLYKVLADKNL